MAILCRLVSPPAAANHDQTDFEARQGFGDHSSVETRGSGPMIQFKRLRWHDAFLAEPGFAPRPSAPREIPLECDVVALLLAEDARSKPRELWLGLGLAGAAVALLASGAGIPLLAIAFTAAPIIGIAMDILCSDGKTARRDDCSAIVRGTEVFRSDVKTARA